METASANGSNGLEALDSDLRRVLDTINEIVIVLDENGVIRYASTAWERILGQTVGRVQGLALVDWMHPDDCAGFQMQFRIALQSEASNPSLEFRLRVEEGGWRRMRLNAGWADRPVGEDVRIVGVLRDITDLHMTEETLRQREELFRSLIMNMLEASAVLYYDGMILMANHAAARMLGFQQPEEMLGLQFLDFIATDDRERAA
ncbi:PAS domain S-box protein, partial [bacterium]|nr:PAS domain S-box protein [bacterium]